VSAAISAEATRTALGEAALAPTVTVVAAGEILGEDWSSVSDESETWSEISAGSEVWATVSTGNESWARQ